MRADYKLLIAGNRFYLYIYNETLYAVKEAKTKWGKMLNRCSSSHILFCYIFNGYNLITVKLLKRDKGR